MLSHEFSQELGSLIRQLESQVRNHPELPHSSEGDVIDDLDRAIVALIAVRIKLRASLLEK